MSNVKQLSDLLCVSPTLLERFWKKVNKKSLDECWNWKATILHSGYGQIRINHLPKGRLLAHRASYMINIGTIPQNMYVLHKCDTPSCVNPNHLFLGTLSDNMKDMENKKRGNHVIGENHGRAKLTEKIILDIIKEYSLGTVTQAKLADKYGICQQQVSLIVNKKLWSYLKKDATNE